MNRLLDRLTHHPRAVVAVSTLLILLCFTQLLKLQADTSIESFIPRGHVSYENRKLIQKIYNINDPLIIDVSDNRTGDIFTPEGLALVVKVSRFVKALPGLRPGSVRSLESHDDIVSTADGFDTVPFLKPLPQDLPASRHVRERVMAFPLYKGLIVSNDGTRAGIIADFTDGADVLDVYRRLDDFRGEIGQGGRFAMSVSGPPIVTGTLNLWLNRDAYVLDPICAVLTCLLLFLTLRSTAGIMLPLSVLLPSVGLAFATMGYLGFRFTPFSNALPVVIAATCIGDSVHVISDYYDTRLRWPHLTPREAMVHTLQGIWKPIFFTSLTTSAGFLTLISGSPMLPVQQFGIGAAVGVCAATLFSLTYLPAIMIWLGTAVPKSYAALYGPKPEAGTMRVRGVARWLTNRLVHTPRLAQLFLLAVILAGLPGVLSLTEDYEPVTFFPRDSAVYKDYYNAGANFIGTNFIEVDLNTGRDDGVFAPALLNTVKSFQQEIESWKNVGGTIALTDYLEKMNQAFNEDRPDFYRIADSADANAQYFLLYTFSSDPRRFDELTDGAHSRLNLRIFLRSGQYQQNADFIRWLEATLPQKFDHLGVRTLIGGEAYTIHHWMNSILSSVVQSVGLTIFWLFIIGVIFLRSWIAALLLIFPDCVGVWLTYGFIGYTDIPVGLGTSIFASIAMGVGIDFGIHYLWRYRRELEQAPDSATANERVIASVGKSIIFNGVIMAVGFAVLLFSKTIPPVQVGTFVAITVVASLATTFLVLATFTRFWHPKVSHASTNEGLAAKAAINV